MKKQDLVKQLANRINQPHVIENWINKIQDAAYKKGFEDCEKKQLSINNVIQAKPEKVCVECGVKFNKVCGKEYDTCPKCI